MATVAEKLLTAEEYAKLPDPGYPTELVRGKIIEMRFPGFNHGVACARIGMELGNIVEDRDLGHVLTNNPGFITKRCPDSVRGPDVAFYSFAKMPPGPLPEGYSEVPPELVFEVLWSDDRWPEVLVKVAEYLEAGVLLVCVVNPETSSANVYRADDPEPTILKGDDEFYAPEILGDFRIPVRSFFE